MRSIFIASIIIYIIYKYLKYRNKKFKFYDFVIIFILNKFILHLQHNSVRSKRVQFLGLRPTSNFESVMA